VNAGSPYCVGRARDRRLTCKKSGITRVAEHRVLIRDFATTPGGAARRGSVARRQRRRACPEQWRRQECRQSGQTAGLRRLQSSFINMHEEATHKCSRTILAPSFSAVAHPWVGQPDMHRLVHERDTRVCATHPLIAASKRLIGPQLSVSSLQRVCGIARHRAHQVKKQCCYCTHEQVLAGEGGFRCTGELLLRIVR
jgi:hypothetical protein